MGTHITEGIILQKTDYSETSLILKVLTEDYGLKSFIFQGAKRKNKKGQLVSPLSVLSITYFQRKDSDLAKISQVELGLIYKNIPFNPIKSSVIFFITELLQKTIKEEESNPSLYLFIKNSILLFRLGWATWRPCQLLSSNNVNMKVVHGLTSIFAIVYNQSKSVSEVLLFGKLCCRDHEMSKERIVPVFRELKLTEAISVLGNNQEMRFSHRCDVSKGQTIGILKDLVAGNCSTDNLVKESNLLWLGRLRFRLFTFHILS